MHLRGRRSECQTLDRLLAEARDGRSGALVLRGEAGVGKTALLQYLGEHADGCRVARAAGVQSEMELAFAGLHQLCAPMLDRSEGLPEPQGEALGTAFGLGGRGGPPACSPRWSSRSPVCTSCARPCSTASRACRVRNAMRSAPRSA